ncbi:translocation/assembly module TamB domain-containing protein [Thalassospira alkalitolerans]|uniref:translocation/assembly module TamB domain-containing protein n=1 Tax=Thalassospira alkalitolerans TaxID=1293890 RepID=UPI003AA9444C
MTPSDTPKSPQKPKRRPIAKWVIRGVIAFGGVLGVLILVVGIAATGPVLRVMTPWINSTVADAIEGDFDLGRIEGSLWTGVSLDRLSLSIPDNGLAVDVSRLAVDWSPMALLGGVLRVDRIESAEIDVVLPGMGGDDEVPTDDDSGSGDFVPPLAIELGKLALGHIRISDPASGKSFAYGLEGRAAIRKNLSGALAVDLKPLDDSIDQLKADIDFDGKKQRLTAEIDGQLDRAGLVMTLAGLTPDEAPDVTLRLTGDGPANDWQGRIDLTASDLVTLGGDIGIALGTSDLVFNLDGAVEAQGVLANVVPDPLRGDIALGIGGRYDARANRLALTRANITKADLAQVMATADIDLTDSILVADLEADIDPKASVLADGAISWGRLNLLAHVKGALAMPDISLMVRGRDVVTPVSSIGSLAFDADMRGDDRGFAVQSRIDLAAHQWQDADFAAMLGDGQQVVLDAMIAPDFSKFALGKIVIDAPGITVNGVADIDDAMAVRDGELIADVSDLSIFAPISGLDLVGTGQVAIRHLNWSLDTGGAGDVAVTTGQVGFGIADLDRVVGPTPGIDGKLAISEMFDLSITLDQIATAMVSGPVNVNISNEFSRLSVKSNLMVQSGSVPSDSGISMAPATLLVALDGDISAPPGTVTLATPSIVAGGQTFEKVTVTSEMRWSDQAVLSLINRGGFAMADRAYNLAADVVLPDDGLHIDNIALTGDRIDLVGKLALPDYAVPMRGTLSIRKLDAVMLSDFGVPTTNGTIQGDVIFGAQSGQQKIDIEATLKGIRLPAESGADQPAIEDVTISGSIKNAFEKPGFDLKLNGRDIRYAPVVLDQLTTAITGDLSAIGIAMDTTGQLRGNIPIKLNAAMEVGVVDGITVRADRLDATIGSQTIAAQKPVLFSQTDAGRQKLDAVVKVGAGNVTARLDHQPGRDFSANAQIADLVLGPWGEMFGLAGADGTMNITADLSEKSGQLPVATIRGGIDHIVSSAAKDLAPVEMVLDVALRDGQFDGTATLGNADARVLEARGTVPLGISFLKQDFAIDPNARIDAVVKVDGEIGQFWPYVPAPDHVLSGKIRLDVVAKGTLETLDWNGTLALSDGAYEHLEYGTLLKQITINGDFDQNGLRIPEITATDGGNGKINGSAEVVMDGDPLVRYKADFKVDNAALSRKDELQFWADVETSVTGTERTADIKSDVVVRRGEVDLTLALPVSVPALDVQNLDDAQQRADDEKKKKASGFVGNLDVTVNIPGRLFVRGRGLDSEWGGTLDITGTTAEPIIVGQLQALRGQLDIIGKTFVIKDSKITFSGATPPDPLLDIEGVYTTTDLTVTAGFSGPASDPELVLSSDPSLPEDEILSQVLFGKSQGSLSAIEAVQLASAVNELSGGGGGFDIVGTIRRFIGADVLQVGGGDDGPNVKVGKYLTEGVYVGTKTGTTPGSSGVEVEIELTPNISVTSETTEIDSKAGVQFRLDY